MGDTRAEEGRPWTGVTYPPCPGRRALSLAESQGKMPEWAGSGELRVELGAAARSGRHACLSVCPPASSHKPELCAPACPWVDLITFQWGP